MPLCSAKGKTSLTTPQMPSCCVMVPMDSLLSQEIVYMGKPNSYETYKHAYFSFKYCLQGVGG